MDKKILIVVFCFMMICFNLAALSAQQENFSTKKILYINSYHEGYAWSDGILEGINSVLDKTGVVFRKFDMDTKRHTSEEFIQQSALQAQQLIEAWEPDVVITSDDNAFKYVIMPYYRDEDLPVVFCGLNWDADLYGAPYRNTTGMIEVALVKELVTMLHQYTREDSIGYLAAAVGTARKEGLYYRKEFPDQFSEVYVTTYQQWKEAFLEMQESSAMMIVGNVAGINDFNHEDALQFVREKTKAVTGTIYSFMAPYAMIGFVKNEHEQGAWAAQKALDILQGASPDEIPVVANKQNRLILNFKIADSLGVIFPPYLLGQAEVIGLTEE